MSKETENPIPTREQTTADLLRLGELLTQHNSRPICDLASPRPIRPEEASNLKAEIAELERRIEIRAYSGKDRTLRSVLGLRKDEVLDPILLRCIACVAFQTLDNNRPRPTVSSVSRSAGLDWGATISARHAIRHAIIRGNSIYYSDSEYGDGVLKCGPDLVRLLSGDNALPVIWTEVTLKQELEAWQKAKSANVLKRVSPPTESSAPSAPSSPANVPIPGNLGSPKAIYESLRQTVIGMDPVVKKFSVQMAMHLKRVAIMATGVRPTTPPVCCLLIGPSGSGKTFLEEEFGRISGLPFCVGDMSTVTSSAYVGSSADELFLGFAKKGTSL